MERFRLGCVQFAIEPNKIEANTEKCVAWIRRAHEESKPKLVALPETITTGFAPAMPVEEFYELVEPLDGPSVRRIKTLAKELGIWICFPMYEKSRERPLIYNSALMISPKGELHGVYRKTHPFASERIEGGGWTTPGREIPVFDLGFAKVGITICYEGDFPELSRILTLKGAEVILRPSALLRTFEIWELTNRARAYDNHVYFAGINFVGPDAGHNYYFGHSMIVSPIAHKLAQARGAEEVISAELDPDPIKFVTYGAKSPMRFDHVEDRNVHIYEELLEAGKCAFEPAERVPYEKGPGPTKGI